MGYEGVAWYVYVDENQVVLPSEALTPSLSCHSVTLRHPASSPRWLRDE